MIPVANPYVDTARDEPSGVRERPLALEPARIPTTAAEWLLADVSAAFGVSPIDVHRHDRHRHTARARHAFWWLARQFWDYSYPELGRLIGGARPWDHTSVITACRNVQRAIDGGTPYGRAVQRFVMGPEPAPVTTGARVYEECRGACIEIESEGQ